MHTFTLICLLTLTKMQNAKRFISSHSVVNCMNHVNDPNFLNSKRRNQKQHWILLFNISIVKQLSNINVQLPHTLSSLKTAALFWYSCLVSVNSKVSRFDMIGHLSYFDIGECRQTAEADQSNNKQSHIKNIKYWGGNLTISHFLGMTCPPLCLISW